MRACRICGCTDDQACLGGCWWVEDPRGIGPVCSSCGPIAGLAVLLDLARHPDVLEVIATA
jgi:hypothetical protein